MGILNFRGNETLQEINHAIRGNLEVLKGITSSNQRESATLTDLARQEQRDSKMLKVLSFIVVMYVPATLVAVCTSAMNSLVWTAKSGVLLLSLSSALTSSASNKTTRITRAMENISSYPPKSGFTWLSPRGWRYSRWLSRYYRKQIGCEGYDVFFSHLNDHRVDDIWSAIKINDN